MKIRLTHLDGKLPNLALMKLAHWHKAHGNEVHFTRKVERELFEPEGYDRVYGSVIFTFSQKVVARFVQNFPEAIIGGTGTTTELARTIESAVIGSEYEHYDYSIYPDYQWSIGFTQRGCRLRCGFCVVPRKEGKPRSVNTIADIWRTDKPKNICLLDNDFFGQPADQLEKRLNEILSGGFKVCFNQGINIRLIDARAAQALSQLPYYDDQFTTRRLYTAWDNLRDEDIFFRGVDLLEKHGVNPQHLMVYMLVGYDPSETMERILYRFGKMTERGIKPYPMVYNNADKTLKRFQRWVIRRYYQFVEWEDYLKMPQPDLPLFVHE